MPVEIVEMRASQLLEAVDVWVRSRWDAEPWLEDRMGYSDEQNVSFFRDVICERNQVWVALDEERVVGVIAFDGDEVDQLHIAPGRQREGIGTALLEKAKGQSSGRLHLYTHQRNERARRFYEKSGFAAVKFGVSPEPEREPDVHYEWRASAPR